MNFYAKQFREEEIIRDFDNLQHIPKLISEEEKKNYVSTNFRESQKGDV